jgi:hypothetical protein
MSFWDDFTGKSARNDIEQGQTTALGNIDAGNAAAQADYARGTGRLDSYAAGGRSANDAYLASLGLSGDQARSKVQQTYMSDPIQNALMDRITRANTRAQTANGMNNSGAATQSLTNALLDRYKGYQDQLMGAGQQGMQAASGQAGIDTHAADTEFGAGQQRAGINIGAANAMAASRGTTLNNLIGIAGVGVKGFAAANGVPVR